MSGGNNNNSVPYTADSRKIDAWLLGIFLYMAFTGRPPSFYHLLTQAIYMRIVVFKSELKRELQIPPQIKDIIHGLQDESWTSRRTVSWALEHINIFRQGLS